MRWLLVLLVACHAPATPYLKGALHVHTNNSGDSDVPPARVASWYAEHGFDFLVFTDHNHVTALAPRADILTFPGVELTQNVDWCDCLLHVNALFVSDTSPMTWSQPPPSDRLAVYAAALDETRRRGGIAQLNHPNFHWGADAPLMAALVKRGLVLFEVANESSDVANDGDATHPSTEALWDTVLATGMIYGTATDDAHQYDEPGPDIGNRGWVMVHATRDRASIRDALARGDFYSSTGVTLTRIDRTRIDADEDCDFVFIGAGGRVVARAHGRSTAIPDGTVRTTVTNARGQHAWVQPRPGV